MAEGNSPKRNYSTDIKDRPNNVATNRTKAES